MATINITHQPDELRPTNYPIVWKFSEQSIGVGAKANAAATIASPVIAGQVFTFSVASIFFTQDKITIYARDEPSSGEIPTSASASLTDISFALIDVLNSNPVFNAYYVASFVLFSVQITALKNGTRWNFAFINGLGSSPQGLVNATNGANEFESDSADSFGVYVDYFNMQKEGYQFGTTAPAPIKSARFLRYKKDENEYYFDLSDFSKGFVNNFDVPALRQTNFKEMPNATAVYNLSYGFQISYVNNFNRIVQEDTVTKNWIINASIPFNIQSDDFQEYQLTSGRTFLTNQPRTGKIVDINESSPLCYFHYRVGIITLLTSSAKVTYTFTDGTTFPLPANYFDTTIQHDGVQYVDIGPANLPIAAIENLVQKEIASYEVLYQKKILGGYSDIFTESLKFVIDRSCKDNKKYIYWRNELGGVDSWTFSGKESKTKEISQGSFSRYELNPRDKYVSSKSSGIIKTNTKINCSTGWMDEDHFNWMMDSLIGSPAVWINETGNIMERIVLVDVTVNKSSDNLMHNILITFEKAENNNHIGK